MIILFKEYQILLEANYPLYSRHKMAGDTTIGAKKRIVFRTYTNK
jgi:hypothetical protein